MTTPEAAPPTSATAKPATSWRDSLAVYLQPRVLIVLLLGFSSGLPLALSGSTLLVWMQESGVDLGTIGLFALVGTPYTLKFLWAPLVDALHVPLFTRAFGRRRGWLVFSQLLLIIAILLLALTDPARSPLYVALGALFVATMSSTQDIVVDAFRVESLPESEQAAGMASYVAAYRIGMLVSTAGALFIVSGFEGTGIARSSAWMWGYVVMAALVLIGTVTALAATEPEQSARADAATHSETAFARVLKAATGAFSEFLTRRDALAALAFVVLFKFTDAFSGTMTAPFVIDLGFTRNDYAAIVKGVGPGRDVDRWFRRRLRGATLFAGRQPVDRRRVAGRCQPVVLMAGTGRRQSVGAGIRDHGGEFHQRHRHRDLRRLSVGAVPQPAAHRDPVRAADGAGRGRADLSVIRRGLCGEGHGMAAVLCDLRGGRSPEPDPAGLAAAARAFCGAGTGQGVSTACRYSA